MQPRDTGLIRQALDKAGLRIQTRASVSQIVANGSGVSTVVLTDGGEIACEMVCIGKGVQPNLTCVDTASISVAGRC